MSCSIWSTRITELRMIMPDSAIVPSMATKPNGTRNSSRNSVTPISPSGAVSNTITVRGKAAQLQHQQRRSPPARTAARPPPPSVEPRSESSTVPPVSQQVAGRQRGAHLRQRRQDLRRHARRRDVAVDVGAHGDRRQAVAMPDDAVLEAVLERGDLRQRHAAPAAGRHRQAAEQRQLRALVLAGRAAGSRSARCPRGRC